MSFAKDNTKPIGGNIIAHASTTRLKFKKGRGMHGYAWFDDVMMIECVAHALFIVFTETWTDVGAPTH